MKPKYVLPIILVIIFYQVANAQFQSIYHAERFVTGTWESIVEQNQSGGFITITVNPELQKSQIRFYSNNTGDLIPSKLADDRQRPIAITWQVKKDERGNYFVEAIQGRAVTLTHVYIFDERDYIIDEAGTKFRRK